MLEFSILVICVAFILAGIGSWSILKETFAEDKRPYSWDDKYLNLDDHQQFVMFSHHAHQRISRILDEIERSNNEREF